MDEGFSLNVLYLVSNTFQVGLGHHLGVLEPYLWCPQIERKGSRDPPWDHGESGRWEIGSPLTYSSQFVPWSKNINSGVSFAVLAAGDQALLSFDVLIHILAFLGYCGYCVSDPRTFHQIFVNPEIDMRYKLNNLRCFFFWALSLTFHLIVFYTKNETLEGHCTAGAGTASTASTGNT